MATAKAAKKNNVDSAMEIIESLTLIEMSELVKNLEDKFGVTLPDKNGSHVRGLPINFNRVFGTYRIWIIKIINILHVYLLCFFSTQIILGFYNLFHCVDFKHTSIYLNINVESLF